MRTIVAIVEKATTTAYDFNNGDMRLEVASDFDGTKTFRLLMKGKEIFCFDQEQWDIFCELKTDSKE